MKLEDSHVNSHGPEGQALVDRDPCQVGYVARARTIMDEDVEVSPEPYLPESRRDFIEALRLLGAELGNEHDASSLEDLGNQNRFGVLLSCPLETWTRVFGKPQNVRNGFDSFVHVPFRVWEHD
ncbi:MAG: hypothetical protein ACYTG0_32335, partial [Planctomycetota bacterium]